MATVSSRAQVNVATWHNDQARTGANTQETILTTGNVNVTQFGRLFRISVDGQVYAQPLVVSGVQIGGGTHNVVYVATEHDSVYAIDADTGATYAQVSLIPAGGTTVNANSDLPSPCGDLQPEIGITGTPVIDPQRQTLYVVAKSKVNGSIVQHLHALNIATLQENSGSPVEIQASAPGKASDGDGTFVTFNPTTEFQRPGLALDQGHVLIAFASHCDTNPYHGWVLAYNAQTLAQEAAWNATPNGNPTDTRGGIWMAGAAPAVDEDGNFYVATGNGNENGTTDFSDSVVKLGLPANGSMPLIDYFVPFNQVGAEPLGDKDLGAGGVVLLPTTANGAQLLVQAGKAGTLQLLDRTNLGQSCTLLTPPCTNGDTQIPQEIVTGKFMMSTPIVWNGLIIWNNTAGAAAYTFDAGNSGLMSTSPVSQTAQTFAAQDSASLSANGATNGIYWIMHNTGELFAYDATNLATVLWRSGQAGANRDSGGSATKWAPPTIANGKVFVGNLNSLVSYGLLSGKATIPTFSPPGGTYSGPQAVKISDATPNAKFFYTTDGTRPTTASTPYTPGTTVTVNASETLQAIATADGVDTSDVGSATYNIGSTGGGGGTPPPTTTATPTFSPAPGTYTAAQSVTISDVTGGAIIYFTTNGSTPTTSSTVYSGPITVGASETLKAIAVAPGAAASSVATAAYTINTGGGGNGGTNPPSVSFPNGFAGATGFQFVGGSAIVGSALQVSDGKNNENRAIWYPTQVNVQGFATDFEFQITGDQNAADGFTFGIQNTGTSAVGGIGGALGYQGIASSVAVKFDLFSNNGEGVNSTGFYTNGAAPTVPALDLTSSGVNLHSGDVMHAFLTYDGATLALTLTDTVTGASFNAKQAIDIPSVVKGNTAYVGFTAGTGGTVAIQNILNWVFTPASVTALPTFSPGTGVYTGAQTVTISDATPGATVYYTTNGSTPTTASTIYTGPITVSASETVRAIAMAPGNVPSGVAAAAYTINTASAGGGVIAVNFPGGFTGATGFMFLGGAAVAGNVLQVTDDNTFENRAAWYMTPVNVRSFTTDFDFQITAADQQNASDGFTFTIQNSGLNALGGIGGALGYQGITPSVAVKFDTFDNAGEGQNSTGFYVNGAAPTIPALDLTASGINLHSGDVMHANLAYDGTTLKLTLTDTATGAMFTASQAIDIPGTVGSGTAFVGFTGGTGGTHSNQDILDWTYVQPN